VVAVGGAQVGEMNECEREWWGVPLLSVFYYMSYANTCISALGYIPFSVICSRESLVKKFKTMYERVGPCCVALSWTIFLNGSTSLSCSPTKYIRASWRISAE
jgi:hypothetical protein